MTRLTETAREIRITAHPTARVRILWLAAVVASGLGALPISGQIPSCLGMEGRPYLINAPEAADKNLGTFDLFRPELTLEIGARQLTGDRTDAKFLEYRDIPRGFVLRNLTSCSEVPGSRFYYRLRSQDTIEEDQHTLLEIGFPGWLKLSFAWDRLPHVRPTHGRNHFDRTGPAEFTLGDGLESLLNVPSVNLVSKRNAARVKAVLRPTASWWFQLAYTREARSGALPVGANFDFTVFELPKPTDYGTDLLDLSAEYAKRRWVLQAESHTSLFRNDHDGLEWINPLFESDAGSSPERGRRGLPPDNTAQTFAFAGAVNLPGSLRLVGTVSPGVVTQNESFLPFTSNEKLLQSPNLPPLPAASLDGRRETFMMNYLLTGQAGKQFAFNVRYHSYDLDNQTPSLVMPNYVRFDMSLPASSSFFPQARRSLPYSYHKENVTGEWIWQPNVATSAKGFYRWERWDRDYREVARSDEHTVGGSWDWTGNAVWNFRAVFQHSWRLPGTYDSRAFELLYPDGVPPFELGPLPELRKYDEANRTRNYGDFLIQAIPGERWSVSAELQLDRSNYPESTYGLLEDHYHTASLDTSFAITPTISVYGEYSYERSTYSQRSRERLGPTIMIPVNDLANNDWQSRFLDRTHTWGGGANMSFWEDQVLFDAYWGLSSSGSRSRTEALGDPAAPGFLVNTAEDYPEISNRFQQWEMTIRLPLWRNVKQRLQYRYERYTERDLAAEDAAAAPGFTLPRGLDSIFLGPLLQVYRVRSLEYTLSFVF